MVSTMNNEPYAWINVNDEYKILFDDELPNYYPEAWMPLYTHPAKTLTDEEIAEVSKDFYLSDYVPYDFVRAILRKAQE